MNTNIAETAKSGVILSGLAGLTAGYADLRYNINLGRLSNSKRIYTLPSTIILGGFAAGSLTQSLESFFAFGGGYLLGGIAGKVVKSLSGSMLDYTRGKSR